MLSALLACLAFPACLAGSRSEPPAPCALRPMPLLPLTAHCLPLTKLFAWPDPNSDEALNTRIQNLMSGTVERIVTARIEQCYFGNIIL